MFIDTHIDTLWTMKSQKRQFFENSDKGHIDLERAQSSDLLAGFFTGFPIDSQYVTENMIAQFLNDKRSSK